VLFLGERPSIRILIGGLVVITGVAVIVMLGQSKTPEKMGAED
jgi:drug/metabolite transporter (DMT)-like permease